MPIFIFPLSILLSIRHCALPGLLGHLKAAVVEGADAIIFINQKKLFHSFSFSAMYKLSKAGVASLNNQQNQRRGVR